jgi:hypothetical protein
VIYPELHRRPVAIERDKHRHSRLRVPIDDWRFMAKLNSLFVVAGEFMHAAREFPIFFVKSGQGSDGKVEIAPIVALGLTSGENLYVDPGDGRWRALHLPALLGAYPLCVGRLDADRYAVCVDESSDALVSEGEGQALFGEDGEPSTFLRQVQADLEKVEQQVELTRQVGRKLRDLDLLVDRRFDATLPDGRKLGVDGFMTVDEERVRALPDATVLDLHKTGVLGLIHAHWISMGHMHRLVAWRLEREALKVA